MLVKMIVQAQIARYFFLLTERFAPPGVALSSKRWYHFGKGFRERR
jgi:hypothetical protein